MPKLPCGTFELNLDTFASHVMNSSPKDVAVRKRIGSRSFLRQFSRTTAPPVSLSSRFHRCSLGASRQIDFANSVIKVHSLLQLCSCNPFPRIYLFISIFYFRYSEIAIIRAYLERDDNLLLYYLRIGKVQFQIFRNSNAFLEENEYRITEKCISNTEKKITLLQPPWAALLYERYPSQERKFLFE